MSTTTSNLSGMSRHVGTSVHFYYALQERASLQQKLYNWSELKMQRTSIN
jgi:hypothetical protein